MHRRAVISSASIRLLSFIYRNTLIRDKSSNPRQLTADSTGPEEIDTSPIFDSRITGWHLHGETGRGIFAGLLAVDSAPGLARDRGQGVIEVVIDPLAPLHDHVCDPVVGRDLVRGDDAGRHESCGGLRVTVVPARLVPADRLGEAVLVDGLEDPTEAGVGRAPGWVGQVVALAVHRAVAVVVAEVQALVGATVRRATRQTLEFG